MVSIYVVYSSGRLLAFFKLQILGFPCSSSGFCKILQMGTLLYSVQVVLCVVNSYVFQFFCIFQQLVVNIIRQIAACHSTEPRFQSLRRKQYRSTLCLSSHMGDPPEKLMQFQRPLTTSKQPCQNIKSLLANVMSKCLGAASLTTIRRQLR